MKIAAFVLLFLVTNLSFAGGSSGETYSCKNDDAKLIVGYEADGIGSLNPLDFHKSIMILKVNGKKIFKDKWKFNYDISKNEEFSNIYSAAQEFCERESEYKIAFTGESGKMIFCRAHDDDTYYLVEGNNEEIYVFNTNDCKNRRPVLF